MKNKNIFQRMKMDIPELSEYYMLKRKERFDAGIPLKGIKLRKLIHPFPYFLVKLDRVLKKRNFELINDDRIKTNRPVIYACTHIGGDDVQAAFEGIKKHAYLFMGDPKGAYKDEGGLLVFMNGVIILETKNKDDRRIAKIRATELLNRRADLAMYPEGAWNLSPNLLVMGLYLGLVQIARATGADIVPVGIEQYDNDFVVSIGKNISMEETKNMSEQELNLYLRDCMATEKWRIIESRGINNRKDINTTIDDFETEIINRCPYEFTVEDMKNDRFHDKDVVEEKEVFNHLKKLNINSKNAFLINKRNHN